MLSSTQRHLSEGFSSKSGGNKRTVGPKTCPICTFKHGGLSPDICNRTRAEVMLNISCSGVNSRAGLWGKQIPSKRLSLRECTKSFYNNHLEISHHESS